MDKGERGDATAARAPKGSLTPAAQTSNSTEAGCLGEGQECGLDDAKCGSYEIVQVPSAATTVVGSEPQPVSPDVEGTSQILGGERDEQSRAEVCVLRTDGFTGNERVCGNAIEFSSPTTQQNLFYWKTRPCSVLILKKVIRRNAGRVAVHRFIYVLTLAGFSNSWALSCSRGCTS